MTHKCARTVAPTRSLDNLLTKAVCTEQSAHSTHPKQTIKEKKAAMSGQQQEKEEIGSLLLTLSSDINLKEGQNVRRALSSL